MDKCISIPLDGGDKEAFRDKLTRAVPEWARMQVQLKGKHLGYTVGPEDGKSSWEEPLAKYVSRSRQWDNQAVGLRSNALIYNTFVISLARSCNLRTSQRKA